MVSFSLLTWLRNEIRQFVIETRRWDPITGTVSAAIGASRDILKGTTDVVARPAKVFKNRSKEPPPTQEELLAGQLMDGTRFNHDNPRNVAGFVDKSNARGCISTTRLVTTESASDAVDLFKSCTGSLVAIPYAFTEGFRNVPRLYGEDVRDIGTIRDWKSGAAAGAKIVVYGVVDGIAGVFVLPYKGAQQQGAVGAIKGVGKGLAGLTTKLFAGMTHPIL